ncbi:MAG: hypothetical protein ACI9YO_000350 [Gammaproteobacteria bacterium]|jgi:hypothetical protein
MDGGSAVFAGAKKRPARPEHKKGAMLKACAPFHIESDSKNPTL